MTYKECREYIRADYYRFTGRKDDSMFRMWLRSHLECGFHFLFWWRLSHIQGGCLIRLISRYLGMKYHISLERFTDVGPGLWIVHGGPIVINAHAHIGANCTMYQYSTIGQNDKGAPVIGDDVVIFPASCVIGKIKVGNRATIGAGSIVIKDVPEGATVAGNPAKVISYKSPGRFVQNKWEVK